MKYFAEEATLVRLWDVTYRFKAWIGIGSVEFNKKHIS